MKTKCCWLSMQNKNGWSLGFCIKNKTYYLRGIRFLDIDEVKCALKKNIVFVHSTKGDKQ